MHLHVVYLICAVATHVCRKVKNMGLFVGHNFPVSQNLKKNFPSPHFFKTSVKNRPVLIIFLYTTCVRNLTSGNYKRSHLTLQTFGSAEVIF